MNSTTQKLKSKCYSINEFLKEVGISLSSYRRWEKEGNANHEMLHRLIDELTPKILFVNSNENIGSYPKPSKAPYYGIESDPRLINELEVK